MPSSAGTTIRKLILKPWTWLRGSSYLNSDALPIKTYLLVSPLGLFAGIRFRSSPTLKELGLILLIGFLSFVGLSLFLWLMWLVIYRQNKTSKTKNIGLVLIGFLAGGIRGALTEILAAEFFETQLNFEFLIQRLLTSGVAWLIAVPVFAHVTSGIREFKKVRDQSLSTLVNEEITRRTLLAKASNSASLFKADVKEMLFETFGPLRRSILESKDVPAVARLDEVLDRLLEGTSLRVREISHNLASAKVLVEGKVSASRLVRESLFFNSINIPTTMMIVVLANFVSPLFKAGLFAALSQAVVGGSIAILFLFSIRNISQDPKAATFNVFLAASAYGYTHSWLQLNAYQQEVSVLLQQSFGSLFLLNFLVLFLALIISGLQESSKLAGKELMDKLESSIDRSRLETHLLKQLNYQEAQALSEYLHGYLQSQLMAISIQLTEARNLGNETQLMSLLSHVEQLASDPLSKFDYRKKNGLNEGIRILAETWAGILTISYASSSNVDSLPIIEQVLALQVIEEAIANAYRHGRASNVDVEVEVGSDSKISVTVTDNGQGLLAGIPGLGSEKFERISAGKWALLNNLGRPGVTLSLQILRITP